MSKDDADRKRMEDAAKRLFDKPHRDRVRRDLGRKDKQRKTDQKRDEGGDK